MKPLKSRFGSNTRKQLNPDSGSIKSALKTQHLEKLASWASGVGGVPSLGAFFGHQLAVSGEANGVRPDHSLFQCQRCESVLQPSYNCTVRVEKRAARTRRKNKSSGVPTQNNVVYHCQFCSLRNVRRGTPKGHMKLICPPKPKPKASNSMTPKTAIMDKDNGTRRSGEEDVGEVGKALQTVPGGGAVSSTMTTPLLVGAGSAGESLQTVSCGGAASSAMTTPLLNVGASPLLVGASAGSVGAVVGDGRTLLDSRRRKRKKPGPKSGATPSESAPMLIDCEKSLGKQRRKKKRNSLKEMAESDEQEKLRCAAPTIPIPFNL